MNETPIVRGDQPGRSTSEGTLPPRGVSSGQPLVRTAGPPRTLQAYCEECFAPAKITDRGDLCDRHYESRRPMCWSCGERKAQIIEFGYPLCLSRECEGRRG